MTAKDKAREMVDNIQEGLWRDRAVRIYQEDAVYTALIAVDEIIKAIPCREDYGGDGWVLIENTEYWKEVKQELDNL